MTFPKLFVALAVVLACVGAVQVGRYLQSPAGVAALDQRQRHRSQGDPRAAVWIVEYSDYACENCRQALPILEDYFKRRPKGIYLQARFFPIKNHRYGLKSALYAECAARQGKFWEFHRILFEKKEEWADAADADAKFIAYARLCGIDPKRLEACVNDPRTEQAVADEKEKARSHGVSVTPTFFINGKMVVGTQELKKELESRWAE